jgi:hypothetical protein
MAAAGCDVSLQECATFARYISPDKDAARIAKAALTQSLQLPQVPPSAMVSTRLRPQTARPTSMTRVRTSRSPSKS